MNPYLVTSVLFLFLAGLGAFDSALTSFHVLSGFSGQIWLRVHLITLGATCFGSFQCCRSFASPGKFFNLHWHPNHRLNRDPDTPLAMV